MAKRTRRPRPAARDVSLTTPAAPSPVQARVVRVAPPAAPPSFWEGYTVAWTKVVVVRLVFFGLLAADAFRQLAHVARYGAGGFNVPQVAWLPLGSPHRLAMIAIHGGLALLFALIAQGIAVRGLLPVATALYAYAYFVSQLDSYQHHYLMVLVLLLWCFVPRAPDPAERGEPRTVRSWALRLILVQLAIVYLWAAIAKLDPHWFDGLALKKQIEAGSIRRLVDWIGIDRVAVIVLVTELTLATTIWMRRTWWIALPLGLGLHAGIELVGLEIGLFSYLVMALYLLLVPDRVYHAIDRATGAAVTRVRAGGGTGWLVGGAIGAVAAAIACALIPLSLVIPLVVVGLVVAGLVARALRYRDRGGAGRILAAFAVAAALPVVLARTTDTLLDHYRYRAGAARRLGDDAAAREAYRGMLAVDPSSEYAHYYLGNLEQEAGHADLALAHYHAAEKAAPRLARSFVAEARMAASKGDVAGAQALIRDALAADPEDSAALEAERSYQSMTPAEGGDPKPRPPSAPPPTAPPTVPPTVAPPPTAPPPTAPPAVPAAGVDGGG